MSGSVSYTHLDVYKRQAYTVATYVSTGWYPDKRGLVSGLCMAFTGGSSAFLAPICSKPVSYTHLDVYKRQA